MTQSDFSLSTCLVTPPPPHPHAFVSCLAWFGYLIHVLVWLLDSRDINIFNFREEKEKKNQQQLKTKASLCSDQC